MSEKSRLRERMRAEIGRLPAAERLERSRRAAERLDGLAELSGAANLLLFRSRADEVETETIFAAALARGQALYYPRVAGSRLIFSRVSTATTWRRGSLGALEPESGDSLMARDLDRGSTVVVVPGLAFSERGERLGRGGGHYDRALRSPPLQGRVTAIGLAFDLQVLPAIPRGAEDARVDWIVTESRTIRVGRKVPGNR